jgi:hypothetical protein
LERSKNMISIDNRSKKADKVGRAMNSIFELTCKVMLFI